MQKQSIMWTIVLCILFSIPGIGCVSSIFGTESTQIDNPSQVSDNDPFGYSLPPRPSGKQDPSLIVTGKYEGEKEGQLSSIYIQKTNNDRYPFKLKILHAGDERYPHKRDENNPICFQDKNTLICANEYDGKMHDMHVVIKQINNTEIDVEDRGYSHYCFGRMYRSLPGLMHKK